MNKLLFVLLFLPSVAFAQTTPNIDSILKNIENKSGLVLEKMTQITPEKLDSVLTSFLSNDKVKSEFKKIIEQTKEINFEQQFKDFQKLINDIDFNEIKSAIREGLNNLNQNKDSKIGKTLSDLLNEIMPKVDENKLNSKKYKST